MTSQSSKNLDIWVKTADPETVAHLEDKFQEMAKTIRQQGVTVDHLVALRLISKSLPPRPKNTPVGLCHGRSDCQKPTVRFFIWPLWSNGKGEIVGGEYCRKHGKKFRLNCQEDDRVSEVTRLEYITWQIMES